jgi:N-acyl-D-aspartate/D-glutamate deacylase
MSAAVTTVGPSTAHSVVLDHVRLPGATTLTSVVCKDGLIEAVGVGSGSRADRTSVIDCDGHLVVPAFVDVHSHADGRAWEPTLSEPKRHQGIAVEVVGNCGLGPAPTGQADQAWFTMLGGVLIGCPERWSFGAFGEYRTLLEEANRDQWPRVESLLPYGAIRTSVCGWRQTVDDDDLAAMRSGVEQGLEEGAVGVSLGLVYAPSDASTLDELASVLRPLTNESAVLTAHIRGQANRWIEAVDEVLVLARRLQCRLLISHLCVGGARNQWKLDWVLARLYEARREGLDVWFDQHPYAAGSTSLTQLLPSWAMRSSATGVELAVTPDELRQLISSPSAIAGWENYVELIGGDQILIAGADADTELVGRTISDIQHELDTDVAGTLVELLARTHGSAAIVLTELYDESAIERIAAVPFGCFSTDGVHSSLPHPRLYGTYPYAFHRFVASGLMTETEFVERTSRRPSQILFLGRRGGIEPGAEADLVVVDPQAFDHRADYLNPWNAVTGLDCLVLGGSVQDVGRVGATRAQQT